MYDIIHLLQVVGIVFAIQTRKVKVKVLNDAKWIAAIIYSSSLCVIVIILSKFTLTGYLNTETALINTVVLLATTIFLALAFVPKVLLMLIIYAQKNIHTSRTDGKLISGSRWRESVSKIRQFNICYLTWQCH